MGNKKRAETLKGVTVSHDKGDGQASGPPSQEEKDAAEKKATENK